VKERREIRDDFWATTSNKQLIRTNKHFTLKTNTLARAGLGDSSDLPDPAILAAEIVEDLQAPSTSSRRSQPISE
jgi:hypothetical protein